MIATKTDIRSIANFRMHKITSLHPLPDYILEIGFEDGVVGKVNLKPLIDGGGVFSEISPVSVFETVGIGDRGRFIFWQHELEIDADSLYLEVTTPTEPC